MGLQEALMGFGIVVLPTPFGDGSTSLSQMRQKGTTRFNNR
jgi:hypothetical protein